jgi:hypothetical protein
MTSHKKNKKGKQLEKSKQTTFPPKRGKVRETTRDNQ